MMNYVVNYSVESGICLATFYILYWFFLRNETYFRFNRFFLLAAILLSSVFPLVSFSFSYSSSEESIFRAISNAGAAFNSTEFPITSGTALADNPSFNWTKLFIVIYLVGAILLILRMVFGILRVVRLKRNGRKIDFTAYTLVYIPQELAPFSYFSTVFLQESMEENTDRDFIINHEIVHVKQLHTCDNLIVEVCLIVFWFNPFIWVIKRALRNTHEYLADAEILSKCSANTDYQSLLLRQINGNSPLVVTSSFNSMIGKRIRMMCSSQSSLLAQCKPLLVVPLLVCLALVFACDKEQNDLTSNTFQQKSVSDSPQIEFDENSMPISYMGEKVHIVVEEMPSYKGEGVKAFRNHIIEQLRTSEVAMVNNLSGMVIVQIIIDFNGEVSYARVVRSIDPLLDQEAIRIVKSSPKWEPGKHMGKPVNVLAVFPVNFSL